LIAAVQIEPDGSQTWVRHQNGTINEGGNNKIPRKWDNNTGLNNNPFKRGNGHKKKPPRDDDGKGPKDKGDNNK